jgi:hypothetical protein
MAVILSKAKVDRENARLTLGGGDVYECSGVQTAGVT